MQATIVSRIESKLIVLYGEDRTPAILQALLAMIETHHPDASNALNLSQKDVLLITYGDMVSANGEAPLKTLHIFLKATIKDIINTVHILPFYPYSSDDGFSVIDYEAVDAALGSWDDVRALHEDFGLMFDLVLNHISAHSAWFQAYLRGEAPYDGYFIDFAPESVPTEDLKRVRRPRTLPLLTSFKTAHGEKQVWTTFSEDQIDLDFSNPAVLLEMLRILLFYVKNGADFIRLDAITYLWKTLGTECVHLPQTHAVAQLMRDVLDLAAPSVVMITETNVPHHENISYFGDGTNEAQMVYNFALPPLLLHTFNTGDSSALASWASTLERVGERTTYFNFTASHDGIGVTPVRGILSNDEIDALVQLAEDHGGFVSYKNNADGTRSPYELNITYFDAITDPAVTAQDPETAAARFICSQAIMLALVGVPGIYFHSLFGSRNWREGAAQTGRSRTINREKLAVAQLQSELADLESLRHTVFTGYQDLLKIRRNESAFHPLNSQKIHTLHPAVLPVERGSGAETVLALHNVTGEQVQIALPAGHWQDLKDDQRYSGSVVLEAYQVAWLKIVAR